MTGKTKQAAEHYEANIKQQTDHMISTQQRREKEPVGDTMKKYLASFKLSGKTSITFPRRKLSRILDHFSKNTRHDKF